jgi:hypothetical protein
MGEGGEVREHLGGLSRRESLTVIPGPPKAEPGIQLFVALPFWIPGSVLRTAPE